MVLQVVEVALASAGGLEQEQVEAAREELEERAEAAKQHAEKQGQGRKTTEIP